MHDVVGVAAAGVAAGELALAAIAVLQGAAQGGRDRARPATDLKHLAVGAVSQRHEGGIAGKAARSLPAQVQTAGLVDDRLTGVEVRWRRRTLAGASARLGRCRYNLRRGSGRLTGAAASRLPARGCCGILAPQATALVWSEPTLTEQPADAGATAQAAHPPAPAAPCG